MDTSIHDFLSQIEEPTSDMAYALVTCLDSSSDVASLSENSPLLKEFKNQGKFVGKGVLLTIRRLLALERRQRIFFGFDEVWFFSQALVCPKPENVMITGPGKIPSEMTPDLTEWMRSNGASLGLGDGVGMNFCARLHGVARRLVESLSGPKFNLLNASAKSH
jgi:hypothetical protein